MFYRILNALRRYFEDRQAGDVLTVTQYKRLWARSEKRKQEYKTLRLVSDKRRVA